MHIILTRPQRQLSLIGAVYIFLFSNSMHINDRLKIFMYLKVALDVDMWNIFINAVELDLFVVF